MKKFLTLGVALVSLVACSSSYDYYKGGVRYTQEGEDCVYYMGENGRHFNSDIRNLDAQKRIVYRNTRCADLYARDSFANGPRADRQVLTPVVESGSVTSVAGGNKCSAKFGHSKYMIVSAM